jgi:DNA-binding NarL/FixJ family response regulator
VPPKKPGVVVISADLDSGTMKGVQLARSVSARTNELSIVILLESLERETVLASFRSGAKGVFCRTEALSELHGCIERVAQGRIWTGRAETEYLLEAVQSVPTCDGLGLNKLTKREVTVAEMVGQGLSNKQIAQQLNLSEHTVKNHLFRIFDKLKVTNRIGLLFLMVKGSDSQNEKSMHGLFSNDGAGIDAVTAAERGLPSAQLMLGMAHLEGKGFEKNDRVAYHWLRMAELNSAHVLEQSRSGIEELRSRLGSDQLQELEQEISRKGQDPENSRFKPVGGKLRQDVAYRSTAAW